MLHTFKNGQGSIIIRAKLLDSSSTTGAGLTGLLFSSTGLIISTIADNEATATAYTAAGSTTETITTLGTYAAPTATKCRFKEVDATNHKGLYEFQFADARFAVASAKSMIVSVLGVTNLQQADFLIQLQTDDPYVAKPANSNLLSIDASGRVDVIKIAGTTQTARDIGASVLLSSGTGTGQLNFTSGVVNANVTQWRGTNVSTPLVAGVPNVNVTTWNELTTVALPLAPTVAGRTLDVSVGGEAGVDWANVGSPTTALALTGTTIATTQKVDVETIKTNPVVNAGTITFPTTATLASTTNITAGTIATVTNLTNAPTAGDLTAAMIASVTTACTASTPTAAAVTGAVGSVTGSVGSVTGLTASNLDATISSRMATYTQPTGFLAATFPTGTVANTTNITAGTITTVTNLTNAATSGDLTATMKTSVGTAITGNATIVQIQADTDDIQTRIPAALSGGNMKVDILSIGGSTAGLDGFKRAVLGNVIGTVGVGSTTTSIVSSALTPAGAVADQFKGKIITFSQTTTTAALRGQSTDITASTGVATPTFTCTALTSSAVSGDEFVIT